MENKPTSMFVKSFKSVKQDYLSLKAQVHTWLAENQTSKNKMQQLSDMIMKVEEY